MLVRRTSHYKPFTSVDGSEIIEVIGKVSTGTVEVSVAYASVKPKTETLSHKHSFTEISIILKGKGEMHIEKEHKNAGKSDHVFISAGTYHHVANRCVEQLEIICICTPAFTKEETEVKLDV